MNAERIVSLIDRIQGAWPYVDWTEAQTDLWIEKLEPLDDRVARLAIDKLIRTSERPPSVAAFLNETHAIAERRRPTYRALEPPRVDREQARRLLAAARAAVSGSRVHDHHGGYRTCRICVNYPPSGNPKDAA